MTSERVQTSLRFVGDWPWWLGCGAALVLGLTAWLLYRRDALPAKWWIRALLPTLRALAIAMIVLMLSGPVLHHRKVIGQLSRLLLFVDGSRSMELTDPSMDVGRKILVLQRLGLLREDAVKMDLPHAGEALAEAQAAAEKARLTPAIESGEWSALVGEFTAKATEARNLLAATAMEKARVEQLSKELVEPTTELARRELKQIDDRARAVQDLARLGEVARAGSGKSKRSSAIRISDVGGGRRLPGADRAAEVRRAAAVAARAGDAPRRSEPKLLMKLAETHDVQLFALDGRPRGSLWQPTARDSTLPTALPKPTAETTNLATGIKSERQWRQAEQRGAVVLFSDGQHNDGESPVEVAKVLGEASRCRSSPSASAARSGRAISRS